MEKKRGRKKQTQSPTTNDTETIKVPKKRGRKPKGGKIIVEETKNKVNDVIKPNIILHLKCKLDDITKTNTPLHEYDPDNIENIIHYNIQQQNKGLGLQFDVIDKDEDMSKSNIVSLNMNEEIVKNENVKDISSKLKELSKLLHNNIPVNETSSCFWCTCTFSNHPIFIPQHKQHDIFKCYGHFCSPSCAAGYLFQENIDTSVKYERYQLLNLIYNKVYNYEKNIVPAPSPHYLLDKFCGNLTIDEYRNLMGQDKVIFLMDKPLSRNYPELFEENNELQIHTINTYSKKKKDVSKQNIFHTT